MVKEESPDDILYVRNENGGVQDVTREFADLNLYETTNAGNKFLLPGWAIITEQEARKAHPQLFGVADPSIRMTAAERKESRDRAAFEAEAEAEDAAAKAGRKQPKKAEAEDAADPATPDAAATAE